MPGNGSRGSMQPCTDTHIAGSECILNTFLWKKVLNPFSASQKDFMTTGKTPEDTRCETKQNKPQCRMQRERPTMGTYLH